MNPLEFLESRRLLAAALNNGILSIDGTPGDDGITVAISSKHPDRLIAFDGSQEFSYALSDLRLIRINAGRGNYTVYALSNNGPIHIPLSINAGAGNDSVIAGSGNDTIIGETGTDTLHGGPGNDFVDYSYVDQAGDLKFSGLQLGVIINLGTNAIEPGRFVDELDSDIEGAIGTAFRDQIFGTGKDNTIIGGGGPDLIKTFGGNDVIEGGNGDDNIDAGSGNDTISGGRQNDVLAGGDGDNVINGNAGDDEMSGGTGSSTLDGGDGIDTVTYNGGPNRLDMRVSFDGEANDGSDAYGASDNVIEADKVQLLVGKGTVDARQLGHSVNVFIDNGGTVYGSEFDDQISLFDGGQIFGNGGDDEIHAAKIFKDRRFMISGGAGNDSIFAATADTSDSIDGDAGNDYIICGKGNDTINGGPGNDSILGGADQDVIHGNAGNDTLNGDAGNDTIFGDDGADHLKGGGDTDQLTGGAGSDTFRTQDKNAGFVQDFEQDVDVLS
jgi:Ca2+-binding RTX toxin-like protein